MFCFIVASSDGRMHLLIKCIQRIKQSKYKNADVFLYYQGHQQIDREVRDFCKGIIIDNDLRGVFTPRYELMKRFGVNYDYTIIIDDDLFLLHDTDYDLCMQFMDSHPYAGAFIIPTHREKRSGYIECVSDSLGYYNIYGGMVLSKKAVVTIVDYFRDKQQDYTQDVFWLLLYIKGFDLYRDNHSSAVHLYSQKSKTGQRTGFLKMIQQKKHLPMLSQWFYEHKTKYCGVTAHKIKELKDITPLGVSERMKNVMIRGAKHDENEGNNI